MKTSSALPGREWLSADNGNSSTTFVSDNGKVRFTFNKLPFSLKITYPDRTTILRP